MALPNILDYLDYREWLKITLDVARQERPWFSLRYLGGRLSLDAANLLRVVQKERHLPSRCVSPLVAELGMIRKEQEYLDLLIQFAKAPNPKRSQVLYERILSLKCSRPSVVGTHQYSFYKDWKHTAILALLHLDTFRGNLEQWANRLDPKCTAKEVQQSLDLLVTLGLARKESAGRIVPNESLLTTGDSWKDIAIREFQKQTLRLAEHSLDRHKPQDRDISTVTVAISHSDMDKIRELTRQFRRSVLQVATECANPDQVFQMNLQFFPMSRPISTESVERGDL